MSTLAQAAPVSVGTIKSFGPTGPMYEVLGSAIPGPKGEMVQVKVVFTGEELAYPLADMLDDPLVP